MNVMRLADMDAVDKFLDFDTVPNNPDYFPLDDSHKEELDDFYRRIPLKTRVICPMPEDPN